MSRKGKELAGKVSNGKRKLDDDKSGGGRKRTNPNVLRFFEDAADEVDDSSDSDFDGFFDDDEFDIQPKVESEPGNAHSLPVFPKEEEMAEEDFDRMMEERYKDHSRFTYAGDNHEMNRSVERNSFMPSDKEPTIWKVKCTVNHERHSAFCLMQKYVDLKSLGTKLQIISAFAVEHLKGHIYIEADRQCDVVEACRGLCGIYVTRVWAVPKNEVFHLLSVRNKRSGVSEGTWVRVKNGKYKGDLAQVVAVNDERKRATVKLIPRIDLQALAQKFGSGVPIKRTATPAPRLISSSELEEFRPLIQYRRDRDTGLVCENLDSLMLKDGYLYKRVSIDSLSCSGVMPTEDELLKFQPSENEQSGDVEWLSQLYGEQKKKRTVKFEKGGGKGESSSGPGLGGSFELHDLVCFGRKDFGLVIGTEKDESYKILKEGSEGPIVMSLHQNELKNGLFDAKFTALDKNMKSISINDSVRVVDGPSQGKQGTVKQIYRGTIFLYDENETENGGYFCSKSQMCEKIKLSADPFSDKVGGEAGPSGFDDLSSSPKSSLLPKNPWQARENKRDFNQGDKGGMYSIGQTLRIRVGPLKGYLCRVLAVRRTDITVKLDSQQKVLTVKSEHLCEVRGKSSNISVSEDPESSSLKQFDLLGTQGSSSDWMNAAGTSAESDGWNSGGASAERSSWPSFPASASGFSVKPDSNPFGSSSNDRKTDVEGTAWDSKVTPSKDVSWGTSAAKEEAVANCSQVSGWGKSTDSWNKATADGGSGSGASAWGKAISSSVPMDTSKDAVDNWGKAKPKTGSPVGASDVAATWEKNDQTGNQSSGWGQATAGTKQQDPWGKRKEVDAGFSENNNEGSGWNHKKSSDQATDVVSGDGAWGKAVESCGKVQEDSWGKAVAKESSKDGPSESKADWRSSTPRPEDQIGGWAKQETGNSSEGSGWKKAEVSSRSQPANWGSNKSLSEETTGWSKGGSSNHNQTDSWNKSKGSGADGGSGWSKPDEGGSWNKQDANSSWERPKSFDGGQGFGGRSGRGGGRGGRDPSGAGRWSSNDQSAGWNREGLENSDSWKKSDAPGEGTGSDWKKGWGADKESGVNLDSGWGKKSTWNSGPSEVGGNQDSGWGKKSAWNSGSSEVGGSPDSGWGKKSTWNSGSSGNQDSDWGKKSSWDSGAGGSENQTDTFGDRASGGNWRGGRGGRGGSERGGFRGRGSYGGRGGSDSGEFGGRGGYGGRGGGFGGRGRGRRDQSEEKPSSWNSGEGWKSNDGGGSWSKESGDKGNWQSWKSGSGGTSRQGGGWNSQGNDTGGGGNWKSSDTCSGDQWSSWNKSNNPRAVKGPASGSHAGDEAKPWNQPKAAEGGQSSGWNDSWGKAPASTWGKGREEEEAVGVGGGGEVSDPWGKAATSSWGKGDNGGGKGGW